MNTRRMRVVPINQMRVGDVFDITSINDRRGRLNVFYVVLSEPILRGDLPRFEFLTRRTTADPTNTDIQWTACAQVDTMVRVMK